MFKMSFAKVGVNVVAVRCLLQGTQLVSPKKGLKNWHFRSVKKFYYTMKNYCHLPFVRISNKFSYWLQNYQWKCFKICPISVAHSICCSNEAAKELCEVYSRTSVAGIGWQICMQTLFLQAHQLRTNNEKGGTCNIDSHPKYAFSLAQT